MVLWEFNTFQYGAGLVFVINVACVISSTRPTRVFARVPELPPAQALRFQSQTCELNRKARESMDENSRDSQGVFHAGTTQYFSSGALPEINLWSRCKGELFYFCLNCCYQTGSDPGDRASQAWSSLIIEGKWFVLFMVDYAFDVSIFTCILYHYCSLVFYLMAIMK